MTFEQLGVLEGDLRRKWLEERLIQANGAGNLVRKQVESDAWQQKVVMPDASLPGVRTLQYSEAQLLLAWAASLKFAGEPA